MKTNYTRQILPLAAIALIAAGCDPFPAKPGGDPRIVRVTSTDQSWTAHSVTVENTGAAGTVAVTDAFPLDLIYVQFNKPMNGLTLQKYPNYDANGVKVDPATVPEGTLCAPPANLTHNFGVGTTFCYSPSAVADGGQLVITPGAALAIGTTYSVTGTVQDYQGKSLAIDVSVTVDPLPQAAAVDGLAFPGYGVTYAYTMIVDWFPTGAATYSLQSSPDGAAWSPSIAVDAATYCFPATDFLDGSLVGYDVCEYAFSELLASTDYWFRVGDGAAPTTWREVSGTTRGPLPVTLTNFALTTAPSVLVPGAIQLAWGRVKGTLSATQPWIVERAPDVGGVAGTFADITATLSTTAGTPRALTSATRGGADQTATPSGTTFWYRVRPNYASGVVRLGAESSKTSY
jgi:hypothetical protein